MARAKANLGWLESVAGNWRDDPALRKLGSCDCKLGLLLGDCAKLVRFEAFEIAAVDELDPDDTRDADLIFEMPAKDWNAYLRLRKTGKGPSLLALDMDKKFVRAANPLKRLMFERYNSTFQALVDRGAGAA